MTATLTQSVKQNLTSRKVWVRCSTGVLPLEWPRVDPNTGKRAVDDDTLMPMGNRMVKVGGARYRNIETRIANEQGIGAQSAGFMELDLLNPNPPDGYDETDAQFLARIKDWIANSGDSRIVAKGVRVEEGNPFPLPFGSWDTGKPKDVLNTLAGTLGDDHEANLETLRKAAGYELSRTVEVNGELVPQVRQEILDGLDAIAGATGDESADDEVED